MPDFVITKGTTKPTLSIAPQDVNSAKITVASATFTGATVRFRMQNRSTLVEVVNAPATIVTTNADLSYRFTYAWVAADTALAGSFWGSFIVTFADASTETWPTLATANGIQILIQDQP